MDIEKICKESGWFSSRIGTPAACTDRAEFARQYSINKADWDAALKFLEKDLAGETLGRHDVPDSGVYGNVQEYVTKDTNKFEYHEAYVDVQFMIKGSEFISVCKRSQLTGEVAAYSAEGDCALYADAENPEEVRMAAGGVFTILFPQDAHRPGLKDSDNAPIKKVVVKIPYKKA